MRQVTRWIVGAILLLGAAGLRHPAYADLMNNGNSITVGDAMITLQDCLGSPLCNNGAATQLEFVAAPGVPVGFVIENVTPGGPVVMFGGIADLTANFVVTTTTPDLTTIELSATG